MSDSCILYVTSVNSELRKIQNPKNHREIEEKNMEDYQYSLRLNKFALPNVDTSNKKFDITIIS